MILTLELEISDKPEVVICFDGEGVALLIKKLEYLRENVDHLHLMTPAWAGSELTEQPFGGEKYTLLNSLRLVRVPDLAKGNS